MSRMGKALGAWRQHVGEGATAAPWLPWQARWRVLRMRGAEISGPPIINPGVIIKSARLTIGQRVLINSGVILDDGAHITLGDDVAIGPGAKLITSGHTMENPKRRASGVVGAPIIVETGAWIGAGAIILPGVTIGHGCVIGAGAVVTRDTEPDGLYLGCPARRFRDL